MMKNIPPIRVLHIIDSLSLGGAERVAVNMTNELTSQGVESHLCVSRNDGPLRDFVSDRVHLFFLNKRGKVDIAAIGRLRDYIRTHKIQLVHAHSSSIYVAAMVKMLTGVKLVWHWHNGAIIHSKGVKAMVIRRLFMIADLVYTVNEMQIDWATTSLQVDSAKMRYLPNFPDLNMAQPLLKTAAEQLHVVVLSNLRYPKDHHTLLEALSSIDMPYRLSCVGRYSQDDQYYQSLTLLIQQLGMEDRVELMGQRSDVGDILSTADIAVLSSRSEGLPVSLLEYGLAGLAVICTRVGECPAVLGDGKFGMLVESGNVAQMADAIQAMMSDSNKRATFAALFQQHVRENYSKEAIMGRVIEKYREVING